MATRSSERELGNAVTVENLTSKMSHIPSNIRSSASRVHSAIANGERVELQTSIDRTIEVRNTGSTRTEIVSESISQTIKTEEHVAAPHATTVLKMVASSHRSRPEYSQSRSLVGFSPPYFIRVLQSTDDFELRLIDSVLGSHQPLDLFKSIREGVQIHHRQIRQQDQGSSNWVSPSVHNLNSPRRVGTSASVYTDQYELPELRQEGNAWDNDDSMVANAEEALQLLTVLEKAEYCGVDKEDTVHEELKHNATAGHIRVEEMNGDTQNKERNIKECRQVDYSFEDSNVIQRPSKKLKHVDGRGFHILEDGTTLVGSKPRRNSSRI